MAYGCKAERVQKPSYNETSLVAIPGSRTTLYTGVCRVWEVSGGAVTVIGEVDIAMSTTNISFPYDAPVFKMMDEIVITSAPDQDTALVNKRFQIQSKAMAGELRATRRYIVKAVN